tara:strand:- start:65 stop:385 length:321 start_codon:yes stop_codon:yes gene_type:complete
MKFEEKIQMFLSQKQDEVIQVIISERKSNGNGVFFVYFLPSENKVDCLYLPFHSKEFPKMYLKHYTERIETAPSSVLFLQFMDETDKTEVLFELDLDTRNAVRDKE